MSGIRVMGRDETTWGRESKGQDTKGVQHQAAEERWPRQ